MSQLIPVGLQGYDIDNLHNQVIIARQNLDVAYSRVQSASYGVRKELAAPILALESSLNELADAIETRVVPKNAFANFEAGSVLLQDYTDFDSLQYYSEIRRLKLIMQGLKAALLEIEDVTAQPYSPSASPIPGVIDVLRDDEFIDQGIAAPITEQQPEFTTYTVKQGDSLMSIAVKTLGSHLRWTEIAKFNQITDFDLRNEALVGKVLKIPLDQAEVTSRRENNLVFEPFFPAQSQADVDRANYGRDLELFNGRFVTSNSGDLRVLEGVANVIAAMEARFEVSQGNLNSLHPEYGLPPISDASNLPLVLFLDKLFRSMEVQASADPRILAALVDEENAVITGDEVRVRIRLELLGNQSTDKVLTNPQFTVL